MRPGQVHFRPCVCTRRTCQHKVIYRKKRCRAMHYIGIRRGARESSLRTPATMLPGSSRPAAPFLHLFHCSTALAPARTGAHRWPIVDGRGAEHGGDNESAGYEDIGGIHGRGSGQEGTITAPAEGDDAGSWLQEGYGRRRGGRSCFKEASSCAGRARTPARGEASLLVVKPGGHADSQAPPPRIGQELKVPAAPDSGSAGHAA